MDQRGTEWTQPEIDLVVSDYFDMRKKFLRGEAFIKARHYDTIVKKTGRTKASVERKYMNISATLERLSLPWLKGYAPLRNFQGALLKSVEKFVEQEWNDEIIPTSQAYAMFETSQLFLDEPPQVSKPLSSENPDLERIARKFDPALRDERNRKLGLAGERRVYESEVSRLNSEGKFDLAKEVKWVSQEVGDGAGYDILSFDNDGEERFLEVKTTIGHKRTPFYLSRNERDFAEENADRFRIFRLYEWGFEPRAFLIKPPLDSRLILEPMAYRASFG
jgi:Protein NO VEIN, C-terminal